jgi:hypothetical protein
MRTLGLQAGPFFLAFDFFSTLGAAEFHGRVSVGCLLGICLLKTAYYETHSYESLIVQVDPHASERTQNVGE